MSSGIPGIPVPDPAPFLGADLLRAVRSTPPSGAGAAPADGSDAAPVTTPTVVGMPFTASAAEGSSARTVAGPVGELFSATAMAGHLGRVGSPSDSRPRAIISGESDVKRKLASESGSRIELSGSHADLPPHVAAPLPVEEMTRTLNNLELELKRMGDGDGKVEEEGADENLEVELKQIGGSPAAETPREKELKKEVESLKTLSVRDKLKIFATTEKGKFAKKALMCLAALLVIAVVILIVAFAWPAVGAALLGAAAYALSFTGLGSLAIPMLALPGSFLVSYLAFSGMKANIYEGDAERNYKHTELEASRELQELFKTGGEEYEKYERFVKELTEAYVKNTAALREIYSKAKKGEVSQHYQYIDNLKYDPYTYKLYQRHRRAGSHINSLDVKKAIDIETKLLERYGYMIKSIPGRNIMSERHDYYRERKANLPLASSPAAALTPEQAKADADAKMTRDIAGTKHVEMELNRVRDRAGRVSKPEPLPPSDDDDDDEAPPIPLEEA